MFRFSLALVLGCANCSSLQQAEGRLLEEAGSGSPPPPPPPAPKSPPGMPGAVAVDEISTVTTMVVAGNVQDVNKKETVDGIKAVVSAQTGQTDLSKIIVTISSGSVVIQIKVLFDTKASAAIAETVLSTALATPEKATTFFSTVPGDTIVVLSSPVTIAIEESKVSYPPPPPHEYAKDELSGGAIAGAVIGTLIGAGLIVAGVLFLMKGGSSGGGASSKSDPAGVTFTNVASNQQENV